MNISSYDCSNSGVIESHDEERDELMRERSELLKAENVMFKNSSTSTQEGAKISKDDFLIIKVIGRGGFGKVYMVKKRTNGKVYAMKVLSKD